LNATRTNQSPAQKGGTARTTGERKKRQKKKQEDARIINSTNYSPLKKVNHSPNTCISHHLESGNNETEKKTDVTKQANNPSNVIIQKKGPENSKPCKKEKKHQTAPNAGG